MNFMYDPEMAERGRMECIAVALNVTRIHRVWHPDPPVQEVVVSGISGSEVKKFECPVYAWEIDGAHFKGAVPVSVSITTQYLWPALKLFPYQHAEEDYRGTFANLRKMVEESRQMRMGNVGTKDHRNAPLPARQTNG